MEKIVKVALDAMGGDNAPGEIVKGAVDAVNENSNIKVYLVGKSPRIHEELKKYRYKSEQVEVVNAEEEISCDESPVEAIRKKKDSSMVVGMKMVKDQTADAFVSAGSSGAILVGGQFVVGRIKGVKRAPLAALMPTTKGVSLIIDSGANMDAKPEYLLEFAKMGSIYMEDVVGVSHCKCRCGRGQRKYACKRHIPASKGMQRYQLYRKHRGQGYSFRTGRCGRV